MAKSEEQKDIALTVFHSLKSAILELDLKPGAILLESKACIEFNASRTPIRTAFQRLADSGLIKIIPYKGAMVSLIDLSIVNQSIFMRSAIEAKVLKEYISIYDEFSICDLENNLKKQSILLNSKNFTARQFYEIDGALHKIWFSRTSNEYIWDLLQHLDVHYTRFKILDLVDDPKNFIEIHEEHKKMIVAIKEKNLELAVNLIDEHLLGGVRRLNKLIKSDYASYFKQI